MKKYITLLAGMLLITYFFINSCHKESLPSNVGIKTSFTEEFENVGILENKGWAFLDNSTSSGGGPYAYWSQGTFGQDKAGTWYGFTAYSYSTDIREYAYSQATSSTSAISVSGWMITPTLSVKNGDKISFYTRCDTAAPCANRMQVRLANSSSTGLGISAMSTGNFSTILFDINSNQAIGGFPINWTKYEYTFSGISGNRDVRIGFRHYFSNLSQPRGVGVDLFKFEVN